MLGSNRHLEELSLDSKTTESFTQLAAGLEKTILRMVLESFGVKKYTDELVDATNYTPSAIKYGRPHTDKGWITLLHQNEVNGLEIRTKDGERINIKPSANSFIIISGQSLEGMVKWSIVCALPSGRDKRNKVRYSIGVFARPRGGYPVKVPEGLVDDKNGLLFKPFDLDEYFQH
ncbi:Detected protein of unknown function [Hibiscus syriacus]|uniref:Fe2OG dioxygenase domain-containing protein n=1 Tax=Hibiscus syriacus TaxID=106335 RepID=A0A6A2YXF7_HIBSY|nr:probable 2-oxoglutarate-dependent dioxygenase AOP1 [Hibiscus syriacus]KAE8684138.1 Detected protein of unknown function [Hibiscus syriacus]